MVHGISRFLALAVEEPYAGGEGPGTLVMLVYLAFIILVVAGFWKTFEKAGQPGWAAVIPFFNMYILLKIAGRPGWWLLLMLLPFVNLVVMILVCLDVARNFGKGAGFAMGLVFLGFIFFPILGFGSAQYQPTPAK